MKILMIVLQGMIAVLFSLNLAVAAPSNMQDSSRHLYDRVMEEFKHRDYAILGRRMSVPTRALQRGLEIFLPRCVLLPAQSEACCLDLEDRANLHKAEGPRESSYDVRARG
jgi:hypothetical protein